MTVDLTGLPPTRDELLAFLADGRADAYERAVDRLLASPAYGERWGRHWLDVWRYSDPVYYGKDGVMVGLPHLWRWRDWVVESLNADSGYDRLVVEMLAGDEVAGDAPDALRATGYLARSKYGNADRDAWLQDVVEHAGQAFLGLTLRCARCHDHKYDPVSQADYYRFRAYFEGINTRIDPLPGGRPAAEAGVGLAYDSNLAPKTFLYEGGDPRRRAGDPLPPAVPAVFDAGQPAVAAVDLAAAVYYPGSRGELRRDAIARTEDALRAADAALAAARAGSDAGAIAVAEKEREVAALRLDAVRASLAADDAELAGADDAKALAAAAGETCRREDAAAADLDLARAERDLAALTAAEKPVRAQVAAAEKKVEEARKKIATLAAAAEKPPAPYRRLSPVYPRQSSGRRKALAEWIVGPANPAAARVAVNHVWLRHLGTPLVDTVFDFGLRGSRPTHPELLDWLAVDLREHGWSLKRLHRLLVTSEAYRMSSDRRPGGGSEAHDPDNRFLWRMNARRLEAEAVRDAALHLAGSLDRAIGGEPIDAARADAVPRRSLYFRHHMAERPAMLRVFDGPNPDECYRRDESVAPQQALALANGAFGFAQAARIADRLTAGPGTDDPAFVAAAFETVLGRPPDPGEAATCLAFLGRQRGVFAADDDPARRARESLVHVLLNHNDYVTVR